MKSRIFNTDQVRAIQDGRMTQFMQVVKPQPTEMPEAGANSFQWNATIKGRSYSFAALTDTLLKEHMTEFCPFGKVGDVMAVKETTVSAYTWDGIGECPPPKTFYKADDEWKRTEWYDEEKDSIISGPKWKSAVHMPHEAARLFLRITNIRVMRVQELTEQDAKAQGYGGICDCKNPVVWGACENCYNTGYNIHPYLT